MKFCTSAPSSLRRSGPTGRRQLSFTTISSKTTFRSQRPPRHHYDDPAPPDAQVPLRCPGRAQTLPFAFSVGRRCAACCDSATGPAPRRHQKACALYPSLPPRQPHLNVHENSLSKNRTPLLSFAPPCSTYNDPVKFRTSAPSSLRRSGPTGRRQLSFTTISSKTTFRSQRPPRHHYDDPAPPDAQVPLRCPGRAQTLPFAFSVGRRCAACCDSATGPAPRRHQKAC